jgi:FAD:protein FMN transferase
MKNFFLFFSSLFLMVACGGDTEKAVTPEATAPGPVEFYGNAQGTTYSVICNDNITIEHHEIDDLLLQFDRALSSYIPNSIITRLNEAPAGEFVYRDSFNFFNRCYTLSQQMWKVSGGAFDPTVYPLVDGWGFMKDVETVPDSATVDSLRMLLGFNDGDKFTFLTATDSSGRVLPASKIIKHDSRAKLDFNGIAQGLAVDIIAEKLESRGAKNYFVEIGGEIRVKGVNSEGVLWRIGIDKPVENSTAEDRQLQEVIQVKDGSIATSGSYRHFYEKDGIKYSHTINPKTGYPVSHSLLSATVVAKNCATADAMATAFMVMGAEESIAFLNEHPELNLEVYLIYTNSKGRMVTWYTRNFQDLIVE